MTLNICKGRLIVVSVIQLSIHLVSVGHIMVIFFALITHVIGVLRRSGLFRPLIIIIILVLVLVLILVLVHTITCVFHFIHFVLMHNLTLTSDSSSSLSASNELSSSVSLILVLGLVSGKWEVGSGSIMEHLVSLGCTQFLGITYYIPIVSQFFSNVESHTFKWQHFQSLLWSDLRLPCECVDFSIAGETTQFDGTSLQKCSLDCQ